MSESIGKIYVANTVAAVDYIIAKIVAYYEAKAKETGEGVPRWMGRGAQEFGVSGVVTREQLLNLLAGRHPVLGRTLVDPSVRNLRAAATVLGLPAYNGDRFTHEEVSRLRDGLHPHTGLALEAEIREQVLDIVAKRGRDDVRGVDLTHSVPKSVSLLYAFGDQATRAAVVEAVDRANARALEFVEKEIATVRRRADGVVEHAPTGITAVSVMHVASRAKDPQLHRHNVVSMYATSAEDGRVSKLYSQGIYYASHLSGSVFQAALRNELSEALGVVWAPAKNGKADILGVDKRVMKAFSQRSTQIDDTIAAQTKREDDLVARVERDTDVFLAARDAVAADRESATRAQRRQARQYEKYEAIRRERRAISRGAKSAGRRQNAALESRPVKDEPSEAELREEWDARLGELGYTPEMLMDGWRSAVALREAGKAVDGVDFEREGLDGPMTLEDLVAKELVRNEATFGRKEVLAAFLGAAPASMTPDEILERAETFLRNESGHLVTLYEPKIRSRADWLRKGGGVRYTTLENLQLEKRTIDLGERLKDRRDVGLCDLGLARDAVVRHGLSPEQIELAAHGLVSGSGVTTAPGIAGAGKTRTLGAMSDVWRREGYRVWGLATAAVAAQALTNESGFDRSASLELFMTYVRAGIMPPDLPSVVTAQRDELRAQKISVQRTFETATASLRAAEARDLAAAAGSPEAATEVRGRYAARLEEVTAERDVDLDRWKVAWEAWQDQAEKAESILVKQRATVPMELDAKTVLVVDEAGMVGTEHLAAIMEIADRHGCKVVLTGDTRQIQSVTRGGIFREMVDLGGAAVLEETRRARSAWEREAQTAWWHGTPEGIEAAAEAYLANDRVEFVTPAMVEEAITAGEIDEDLDYDEAARVLARNTIFEQWRGDREEGAATLMVATRRNDVRMLNSAAQATLIELGVLDTSVSTMGMDAPTDDRDRKEFEIYPGDQVTILRNDHKLRVKNGMSGSVVAVTDGGGVRVELPVGPGGKMKTVEFTSEMLAEGRLNLAYASTINKAQGRTVRRGRLLAESGMTLNQLYPAMTRGTEMNTLVMLTSESGQQSPEEQLVAAMARDGEKRAAISFMFERPTDEELEMAERTAEGLFGDQLSDEDLAAEAERIANAAVQQRIADRLARRRSRDEARDAASKLLTEAAEEQGRDRARKQELELARRLG